VARERRGRIVSVESEGESDAATGLRSQGYPVEAAASLDEALARAEADPGIGHFLLGRGPGLELLGSKRRQDRGLAAMLAIEGYEEALEGAATVEMPGIVARTARELFGASAAAVANYDAAGQALVLTELSVAEEEESLAVKLVGRSIRGLAAPIDEEMRRTMLELKLGASSSLSELSFGKVTPKLGSAIEAAFGIAWFRGLVLASRGILIGGLGLAGKKGSEEPDTVALRVFAAISANAFQRRAAEEKVASLLREKDALLREVHHRIKNNLNTASSLLSIQARACEEGQASDALHDAMGRLQSMSNLYDKLYRSDDLRDMSLAAYLPSLAAEIVALFPNRDSVELRTEVEDLVIDVKRLSPLGILVYELVSNAMKHAFPDGRRGGIRIVAKEKGGRLVIVIEDDGMGLPPGLDLESSKGFGLGLARMLAEQLEGKLRVERGKGTRYVLELPRARSSGERS